MAWRAVQAQSATGAIVTEGVAACVYRVLHALEVRVKEDPEDPLRLE